MSKPPPSEKPQAAGPTDARPGGRRRSTRIVLRIPLVVSSSIGEEADPQWEPVETITVSKHGALIRTHHAFRVGDTLDILWRQRDRSARARVAWVSSKQTPDGVELGFEILDQEAFWDVNFPADRWSDREMSAGAPPPDSK